MPPELTEPPTLLRGFRVATFAEPGTVLAAAGDGRPLFRQPASSCGAIDDAVVCIAGGKILWVLPQQQLAGLSNELLSGPCAESGGVAGSVVAGEGRWLTPGLIDCHTHLVYAGNRAHEWAARLAGRSYAAIAREGGGILSTVRQTRLASEDELVASGRERAKRLVAEGVTTLEIKSGYGLDVKTELAMLRAARRIGQELDVSVATTLLGAHAVPPEFAGRPDAYIDLVCEEMVPAARGLCSAVDVFCESIAFSVAQAERVFDAATASGLKIRVHAEQLTRTGISVVAARRGALSVDHLEYLGDDDCRELGRSETVAVLLPGAFYSLHEQQKPPLAELIRQGVPMAVATDSNPGSSPLFSLLLAGNMACNLFGLTPEQALTGMTRNAARALGLGGETGTLEPGKRADFAVWAVDDPAEILYGMGHNPCVGSMRSGHWR